MIDMSSVTSQKENENAIINSGQLPNAIVWTWMGELYSKLGANLQRIINMLHVETAQG